MTEHPVTPPAPVTPIAEGAPPPAAPAVTPSVAEAPAVTPAAKPWGDDKDFDPDKAWKLIENLRADKGKADEKAIAEAAAKAQNELTQQLGKALGLIKDEDPAPDAAALTKALEAKDATIRSLLVDKALTVALDANKASTLTIAVLKGEGKLTDLDPNAADFQAKLNALVKETTEQHPQLKAAQAAGVSGADFTGGTGELSGIDAQIAAAEKAGDHAKAISLKRQKAYTR